MRYTAERLSAIKKQYGPRAIMTTGSSRGTGNETNYVMQKFARAVLNTNNVVMMARGPYCFLMAERRSAV
ncbi:hypothetical protein [Cronobacter sakazakii]|uniref:hypothetical protein n=1 Tax=Cronobacter sakazakii TaxID=28141 RepID=UPI003F6DB523